MPVTTTKAMEIVRAIILRLSGAGGAPRSAGAGVAALALALFSKGGVGIAAAGVGAAGSGAGSEDERKGSNLRIDGKICGAKTVLRRSRVSAE